MIHDIAVFLYNLFLHNFWNFSGIQFVCFDLETAFKRKKKSLDKLLNIIIIIIIM